MKDIETIALGELTRASALLRARTLIRQGSVVAVPTDTVYGLVADAANEDAVEKVFRIKGRSRAKALGVFVKDIPAARRIAYISDAKARFLNRIWPGPVTVVFKHKEKFSARLTGGGDTIGIRIPDYPFLASLLARLDTALVQTSANAAGMPPAMSADQVKTYFQNERDRPDLIIDGLTLRGTPSSVVDFTGARPLISRAGPISKSDLDAMIRAGE